MHTSRSLHVIWIASALIIVAPVHAAEYVQLSGKELYATLCSSCHGVAGRGDGPVSKSLPSEVPDLTLIASRRGGVFPPDLVEKIIDGRHVLAGHGSRTMPVWGEALSRAALGNPDAERATQVVTGRLADHLRALQRPSVSADVPVTSDTENARAKPPVNGDKR